MKKIIKIIIGLIIIAIIAALGAYTFRNQLIVTAIETFVPKMTKTSVAIRSVSFNPFQGNISISDLAIGNPEGFNGKYILTTKSITVKCDPESLFTKKIVINDVLINGVSAAYEINMNGVSNIDALMNNLHSGVPSQSPTSGKEQSSEEPTSIIIQNFVLDNAKVEASIANVGTTIPLPNIRLTNIGQNKETTVEQVFVMIMDIFSKETLTAVTGALKNTINTGIEKGSNAVGNFIQSVF